MRSPVRGIVRAIWAAEPRCHERCPLCRNALTFLVHVVFGLYILILMLRVLLQLFRADYYNPCRSSW